MLLKSKNKGFSLVELIVVIAILVVFAAILIPSLMQYTENSRAQKDVSAMDEVVNAFQLAMADQDCYDEAIKYSCTNNYLTYSDSSGNYGQVIADGEFWAPDGSGRATTITFNPEYGPNNQIIYDLSKGIVNDMTYGNGSVAQDRVMEGALIDNNQCYFNKLIKTYNTVRQTVGTDVITTSQTYRNSSFTVFIRFSQKDNTTVADVNGSFNGTNLYEGAVASKGSGTSSYEPETGAPIVSISTPGTQKSEYSSSDLSGTGNFDGTTTITSPIVDYKQPQYVPNLQKENQFYYYSTLKAVVNDINSGKIGESADREKADGIFGLFFKDNTYHIAVLQDYEISDGVQINQNVTFILNGHKLSRNYTEGQYHTIETKNIICTFDGRIQGSEIVVSAPGYQSGANMVSMNGGQLLVYGGTYSTIATQGAAYTFNSTNLQKSDMRDCIVYSNGATQAMSIELSKCNSVNIQNCIVEAIGTGPTSANNRAISTSFQSANIQDTKMKSISTNIAPTDNGIDYYHGRAPVYGLMAYGQNLNINNCEIVCSHIGMELGSISGTNNHISNTKIHGGVFGLVASDSSYTAEVYFNNCEILKNKNYYIGYDMIEELECTSIAVQYDKNFYFHNCHIATDNAKNSMQIQHGANVYMSMCVYPNINIVRIDGDSMLYVGARNNFSINNIKNQWSYDAGLRVEETNKLYNK